MAQMLKTYVRLMDKHPWKMHIAQTGVMFGLGDLAAQTLVEKRKLAEVDGGRMVRFAMVGTLFAGPVVKGWMIYLEKMFGRTVPQNVVKKAGMDQLVFAPFYLASLLGVIDASRNGRDREKTMEFVRHTWTDVVITNWMFWVPVHVLNTFMIPAGYHNLVMQSAVAGFTTYLAWKTNIRDEVRPALAHHDKEKKRLSLEDFERAG